MSIAMQTANPSGNTIIGLYIDTRLNFGQFHFPGQYIVHLKQSNIYLKSIKTC